ncbi:alpha-ketoacid dehydrogenase kinase N-terminal domain-containing protein [Lentinula raphanica]|nr:branched-chain alpha-ketoacid dehydrogenase kinase [Lentinula raphanica]KAJ3778861.1 alpha-ketoacid dehydrogenase kinase N-terminal domain-containing protein [Lentinula raphanica]
MSRLSTCCGIKSYGTPSFNSFKRPRRYESTALHFYQNKQLELYASREPKPMTLRQLVFYGRSMDEERLVKSANYVRTELPVRIAHRLRDLQKLPYIVVTQEGIAKVYELYWSAFEKFRKYPPITNIKENEAFCEFLGGLLDEHATVIPNLSLGMTLSSPYLPPDDLDSFMRRMLVSRISRRVLAQHHIALSEIYAGKHQHWDSSDPTVGIIATGLNVKASIEKCANLLRNQSLEIENSDGNSEAPVEVVVEGDVEMRFSYIREHLEYIVFELLKNSMRATRSKHAGSATLPPITATIAAGDNAVGMRISDQGGGLLTLQSQVQNPSDLFSFSHIRNSARMEHSRLLSLRTASSYSRGVWATVNEQVESWKRSSDPEKEAGVGKHTRMGIGLPMSNIFATYFGGSLELKSLDGYGTDAYVRLPKLGTNLEAVNF